MVPVQECFKKEYLAGAVTQAAGVIKPPLYFGRETFGGCEETDGRRLIRDVVHYVRVHFTLRR